MVDMYALYLKLFALSGAGSGDAFNRCLVSVQGGRDTPELLIEVYAVAAIAVTEFEGSELPGRFSNERVALLDFYEFQRVWERYRNTAPRT